jgi:phytoene synthase
MKPEQYCLDMAAPAGSSLYYATLYSPAREKRKLHAIFAFQQELLNTVFECEDAGVARLKLQWWGEEIMRLFASESRHPVTRELEKLLPELQLQQNELLSLISAIEYEINPAAAESIQALIE